MRKALLYIGGSEMQVPGLAAAQAAGLYTVLTDMSEHPGSAHAADRVVRMSATDVRGQLDHAVALAKEFELVGAYGVADYAYEAVGEIADSLRLPIGGRSLFATMADKQRTSDVLAKAGVSVPRQMVFNCEEDAERLAAEISKAFDTPLVIKPHAGHDSQGVSVVRLPNHAALVTALISACAVSEKVVVEQFIEGVHRNVDGLLIDHEFYPVSITERRAVPGYPVATLCGFEANDLTPGHRQTLFDVCASAASALGIVSGPISVELFDTNEGPQVIEASPHFHSLWSTAARDASAIGSWFRWLADDSNWARDLPESAQDVVGYYFVRANEDDAIVSRAGVEDAAMMNGVVHITRLASTTSSAQFRGGAGPVICALVLRSATTVGFFKLAADCTDRIMGPRHNTPGSKSYLTAHS